MPENDYYPSRILDNVDRRQKINISIRDSRILVVEDSLANRRLLKAFLESAEYTNIEYAEDGLVGLEKVETYNPDLVILDIQMPNLNGYGFLEKLRADERFMDLPVLVQTAFTEPEQRNKAFLVGGTDLITKPINHIEFISRVRIHLENRILLRSLQDYHYRLENELNAAQKMQEALLPASSHLSEIRTKFSMEIESYFEPSSELGGDFWAIQCLDEKRIAVSMVDFSGHGVNSALNTFRLHTLMGIADLPKFDPASYLKVLNEKLVALIPRGQFATMFYGIVDLENNSLTYSAAASPSPVVGIKEDFKFVETSGMPLGISNKAVYENRIVDFPAGSFLFLYSDALTESEGLNLPMLDEDGLATLLSEGFDKSKQQHPFNYILDGFGQRVPRPLPDDLTAVWMARLN
ncbi:MAG: fused response regulator/phosphatase [Magnetovibrio sp.]|nr:fused response regulator/phosphatase [Magnetovibrio sp.]